ncbi:hypothetical protein N7478_011797 [Penicillium angulare]|uniref:uncharacterized protein n=1 Tax=Penicillium angulare TaxID=116970 RepID=UPI002540ED6D|nr:uncharacterized protein N7478_011797 [Penicillium angulare]KAJ5261202.1 hypothetical protein N7478_011797 [Penicillium angulare]
MSELTFWPPRLKANIAKLDFIQICIVFLLGLTALSTLFNLYFHPLRKFPGPFFARSSNLWGRYQNMHGQKSHSIHASHRVYGPVVRIAPNTLSFSRPAAVRDIYTSKNKFVKEESFYRAKRIFRENHLLSFRDPEAHHQRRKLLSRGFSQAALVEFEPNIISKINTLLDQWSTLTLENSVVDVYPWVHMLGFDTIYNLMFDVDPGTLKSGKEHTIMPWLRSWRPTYIYEHISVMYRSGKRATGTKTPFLSKVLHDNDGFLGRPLTASELAEECMGGMFGGSGTTATTFVYLLWAVLQRPDVVQKLQSELDAAFPDDQPPDSVKCGKLPYLQAVLNETLRVYPATIAVLPRTATVDTIVDGIPIPQGTNVATQNLTIHRDPQTFENPDSFIPERWIEAWLKWNFGS